MTLSKENFVITDEGDILYTVLNCNTKELRKIKAQEVINEILNNETQAKKWEEYSSQRPTPTTIYENHLKYKQIVEQMDKAIEETGNVRIVTKKYEGPLSSYLEKIIEVKNK